MRAILIAFWQRRWFRRLAWTFATLLTLLVLLYVWVNWQGAHRLKAAHASLVRNGETLDLRQIASAPVPEAQNFCAIPLLKNLALSSKPERVSAATGRYATIFKNLPPESESEGATAAANRKKLEALGLQTYDRPKLMNSRPRPAANFSMGTATDLQAWAGWLRQEGSLPMPPDSGNAGRDLLAGFAAHDALVAELAAGLDRTEAQWTPPWRTRELPETIYAILVPHYATLGAASPYFALRASAAAAAGEVPKAHDSLLILLRLSRATLDDPSILGTLVGSIQITLACDATWELARAHAGTAEDFRRLEIELRRMDLRASLLRGFRCEAAGGAEAMQWLKHSSKADVEAFSKGMGFTDEKGHHDAGVGLLAYVLPAGWYDMNAAAILEFYHDFTIAPLRDQGWSACLARQPELEQRLISSQAQPLLHLDKVFAQLLLASTSKLCPRFAYTQDIVNQAIIACALERYYATHQSYPDSLASLDLEGRPLPLDIFSGKPPHYRKTSNGRYALWSVGLDGEDDGGKRVLDPARPEKTRFYDPSYTGDWVWDFPPR